ncbi:enamine deaminase RidA (YjgF/YER057c/UK114 family) [Methylosinus sp. sav-2]|uniref:RidA family protein n=1 Tax=Methylosinus sp. sav-2 TaxID=2485168 RepID=UPI000478D2A5|nr:RidA family protein [Methylosinus sp. sav-2]TDX64885.1 enamine deaminase RidA (YjgF/YER057c/UK114 family) [Methylosinus sp. sav-2]
MSDTAKTPLEKLEALGLTLPTPAAPVANYVPWTRSGNLVFVSGQLPVGPGGAIDPAHKGKLGASVALEAGQAAARVCALNLLAQASVAAGGDLAKLRVLRLGGFINSAGDYGQIPQVLNGASDLVATVLGENGRHARFAVGVAQLPLDAAVEVDATFEILE